MRSLIKGLTHINTHRLTALFLLLLLMLFNSELLWGLEVYQPVRAAPWDKNCLNGKAH